MKTIQMFKNPNIVSALFLLSGAVMIQSQGSAASTGDRHPELNYILPSDVFFHAGKGGRIIDVTQAPFNAKGDGVSDDTRALIKVYDQPMVIRLARTTRRSESCSICWVWKRQRVSP